MCGAGYPVVRNPPRHVSGLRRTTIAVPAFFAACLAVGCLGDAERGNPLDPRSDNFRDAGGAGGAVVRESVPGEGVPGALVTLVPAAGGAALQTVAGGDGRFAFANVPTGRYLGSAARDGYAPDTAVVDVAAGRLADEITFRLNALPRITAQSVRSERINRFFPDPDVVVSQIVVEATVVDPDGAGDLVAVDFVIPDFSDPDVLLFRDTLFAVPNTQNVFRRVIPEEELPVPIQDLLGRNLFIEARDRGGAVARGTDTHVVRIVEAIPVTVFPQTTSDVVSVPFTLQWGALSLPYVFTWRVEVFFVPSPGLEQPLTPVQGIPSTQTELTVSSSLPAGNYAWRVSAVDEFGNLARSREAGFRLQVP
jgi:hypothetical protein